MGARTRWLVAVLVPAAALAVGRPLTVTASSPADGATLGAADVLISVTFSAPMEVSQTTAALRLRSGSVTLTNCDGRWQWTTQRSSVSCQPAPPLAPGSEVQVAVGTDAHDDEGQALAAEFAFSFTIAAAADAPVRSTLAPGALPRRRAGSSFAEPRELTRRPAFLCALGAAGVGDTFTWITRNKVVRLTPSSQVIHTGLLSCSVITVGLAVAAGFSFGQGIDTSATLRRGVPPAGMVSVAQLRAEGEGAIFRGWLFSGLAVAAGASTALLWLLGPPGPSSVTLFAGGGGAQAGVGGTFP